MGWRDTGSALGVQYSTTPSPHLERIEVKETDHSEVATFTLHQAVREHITSSKNMIITTMKRGVESDMMDNILLLVLLAAGELHPGECALGDGGNEKERRAHPDGCHAGDGNQSAEPVGRADPQTDRRRDPGECGGGSHQAKNQAPRKSADS